MILTNPAYGAMAEFHDLFMVEPWARLAPRLGELFGALPRDATIVDLGAGSGMGTRALGRATRAEIVALEPDLVMRSVLLARIADLPGFAERTTVCAGTIPHDLDELPAEIDGFLAMHLLGHLSAACRRTLFAWLGDHLRPGGTGLVTIAKQGRAGESEIVESRRIGCHEYRAIHRAAAAPATYSTRYEVWDGSLLLRSADFAGRWSRVTLADLRDDLRGTGLRAHELEPGLVRIVSRRS